MTLERAIRNGYTDVKIVIFKGERIIAGLMRYAFTTGLVIGIDSSGYYGRWCFHTKKEAQEVLDSMDTIPEDLMIAGNWVKYKGWPNELSNPKYNKDEEIITDGLASELIDIFLRSGSNK